MYNVISLYFDVGLGALIVQGLIATLTGIVLFSKNLVFKVKLFFGLHPKMEDKLYSDLEYENSEVEQDEN